ncbi:hypothetical protein [Streptomyces sp.]|uniref:hypothetical protein n=1 Tax=Streptomyces sp. TaxID=1931 RepID=UPI002F3EF5E4
MPRSIFMGRGTPAPGEPLWLPEDRAWALALLQVEAESCPECGQPWAESAAPENEEAYRAEIHRCWACSAGAQAVEQHQQGRGSLAGAHVMIRKR